MQAIDNLLETIQQNAECLYGRYIRKEITEESNDLKRQILIDYEAVLKNLTNLNQLGDFFLKKKFGEMSDWRYKTTPSEIIRS